MAEGDRILLGLRYPIAPIRQVAQMLCEVYAQYSSQRRSGHISKAFVSKDLDAIAKKSLTCGK